MRYHNNQSGFTLVEIAIVMVIIGLLLGGALKGQAMIANAKVKSFSREIKEIQAAYYSFQDIYRAMPGDMKAEKAKKLLPLAQSVSTVLGGNSDGNIDDGFCDGTDESCAAMQHLRLSGLLSGDLASSATLLNSATPVGGIYMGISHDKDGKWAPTGRANLMVRHIDPEVAKHVDRMLDDGLDMTGTITCFKINGWCEWKIGTPPQQMVIGL